MGCLSVPYIHVTKNMVAKNLSSKGLGKGQRVAAPGREAPDALLEELARSDAAAMARLLSLIPSVHLKVRPHAPPPAPERRTAAPCARPGLHAPRPRSPHA